MRRILSIALIMFCFCVVRGQEFRCNVSVNYQKLMTTTQAYESGGDKKVFENMKQALEDFINGTKWTNIEFEQQEKIECSFSLILNQRTSATDFVGQITIQMKRPVYNSNYTTGLFNYMEQGNFQFAYNESQPLEFDLNNFYSVLASTVSYYCYIMLGIYFDSYAPFGGQPFFETAQQVAQAVDVTKYAGWDSKGGRNRYWFMENHINSAYAPLREAYYNYHRLGLDMMTKDQPKARQAIIAALQNLQAVHKRNTSLLSLQQFIDVKIQEIVSIFTPAPDQEKKQVYELIKDISPINVVKLKGFNVK
ncbi:MAG: DUF4835 family protein [Bacteroidaceae bacterium]|nr:DUF4835 family protein [Bacteroidaceae bacterium]